MVRGPSPGPAPAAQARASNSRLTEIQLADMAPPEAAQKGPQGGWRLDHAADGASRPAGAQHVGVVRMQSPPARAEATSVITLSPVLARPGARPRSRRRSTSSRKMPAQRGWHGSAQHWPPGGGRQRRFGCGRGGHLLASFGCSCLGTVSCFKSHYPRWTGALSYPFSTPRHSSFRWIGASRGLVDPGPESRQTLS